MFSSSSYAESPLFAEFRRLEQEFDEFLTGWAPWTGGIRSLPAGTFPAINVGSNPDSLVVLDSFSDPGSFGTATRTISFGTALDDRDQNVWIRVAALDAATGSGSRDTFGIDNFELSYHASGMLAPIPLRMTRSGGNAILSWSNSAFALQAAPTARGTYTNVPGATNPYTNPITGIQKFFRLKAN